MIEAVLFWILLVVIVIEAFVYMYLSEIASE